MSNVLCPIVARYSLFFTLALFDSSTLALSKQPREDALNMVQRAQAQFQAHHRHHHATKLRALIRNVSTASSSSTSSSSSSSTYSSSHQSQSSASTAPSSTSSTELLSSFSKDVEALSTETVTQFDVTSSQHPPQVKSTPTTSTSTSTSTSSPTSLAPIPSSSTLHISSSLTSSSPTTHPAQKGSTKKTRARRASKPSAAITTLLSISITIILLSLLQSRSRYQLVRQKSIVTQGSHNDRRSHRRHRHQHQQQTKQQAPKQHRLVSTETPSPLTQLCEHSYKGDSATCVPDSVHKVKNTSTSIKAIAPVNSSLSSSSSTLFVFTSTTTATPITTTTMATLAHSTSTLSPTSSKQLQNEFVTAWLQQQTIDPTINCNFDDHLDTNQIEDYHISDYHVSDQQYLHPGTIPSTNSYHHPLLQANHSTAPTSRTTLAQGHGHRRCLSLMNPSTSPVTPTQTTTYEEQLQQQVEWHRQNDQHLHTAATIATTVIPQYPEHPVHPFIEEHTPYWPPQRTAEELAWERHNYYLRLQAEEEELIERLQSDRKQSRGYRTQNKTPSHLWQPRPDASSVARAGSLNRLSGPSLLSAETSRVLGLCRSSTLSAVKKIGFAKKDNISRSSRSTSPLPVSSNTNTTQSIIDDDSILTRGLAIHSYERITTTASNMTAATASSSTFFSFSPKSSTPSTMGASSPPPKNLLKDHLGPSLKSLARRCSTRFGRSSRSNSYAGPSGDAVVEYPHGRRSLGSHPLQQKQRGHLYDFKQLPTGPTGGSTEISTSNRPQEGRYRRSMSNERVPVHRTVTLFRSKSTRAPSSTSMVKKHDDHPTPITTVLDLPYRPHPNSLRFANGRGLDFSNTPNLTSVSSSPSHSNRSSVDFKRNAMSLSSLPSVVEDKEMVPIITTSLVDNLESPSAVFVSSLIPTSVLDFEEHESMRQQIVAILSLDRNDMRRRPSSKPRSRSTTPRIPQDHSSSQQEDQKRHQQPQHQLGLECLSPLAVEAQEVLPEDPKTIQAQEVAAELADPCEHIAFMLVPKAQYEFQPLIAH